MNTNSSIRKGVYADTKKRCAFKHVIAQDIQTGETVEQRQLQNSVDRARFETARRKDELEGPISVPAQY
ncbi:hypothetical protein SCAR479_07602 [Seiridium cardinale]|uniref:Uncharacterized protein n=1 Tax=Seiridium cardinale TaxID=138064 RepID=A0ABR2XPQ1_9PEZI